MKILVLGAGGMAGHVIATYLREQGYPVDTLSSRHALDAKTFLIDVQHMHKLEQVLSSGKYEVVVNAIGVLVQQSEDQKARSVYLNSYLPHLLEAYYADTKTKVIHLSTDCVFSGKNPPYREDSPYDGQLFYDRTKAVGEVINGKDLTFRMSIIGPDMQEQGIGLFNWFYRQDGEIGGYTKAIWNGITTIELARGIKAAIEQNLTGLYHLVPSENITKYELLSLFKDTFHRTDITVTPQETETVDKTLLNTRHDFNFTVADYKHMVEEMKDWINHHEALYPHYE